MGRWQLCLDAPSWVVICSVLRTLRGVNTLTIISVFCLALCWVQAARQLYRSLYRKG